jgi:hypothetical protein
LHDIAKKHVQKGATLITDAFRPYNGLQRDFAHVMVKHHAPGSYYTEGIFHTNNIEGVWSPFKRGIHGIYHNVSPKHLQRYCNEFAYRYNTRKMQDTDRFHDTLMLVARTRLRYKDLIAKGVSPAVVISPNASEETG